MNDRGIKPELEVFEPGMANIAQRLLDKGVLQPPLYVNLLFGSLGTIPAAARDVAYLVSLLPENTVRIDGQEAHQLLRIIEVLEDHDDVQQVHSNFEMDDSVLASYSSSS